VFLRIAAKVSTVFQQLQTDETPAKPAEDSQTNGSINTNLTPDQKKVKKSLELQRHSSQTAVKFQSSSAEALGGKAPWAVLRTGEIYPAGTTPVYAYVVTLRFSKFSNNRIWSTTRRFQPPAK
jgi:hypothetical protein